MTPQTDEGATVIPFPAGRAGKSPVRDGEPRGHILFFTGVRYERMPETRPARRAGAARKRKG